MPVIAIVSDPSPGLCFTAIALGGAADADNCWSDLEIG